MRDSNSGREQGPLSLKAPLPRSLCVLISPMGIQRAVSLHLALSKIAPALYDGHPYSYFVLRQ
jgi:hypothetical protein